MRQGEQAIGPVLKGGDASSHESNLEKYLRESKVARDEEVRLRAVEVSSSNPLGLEVTKEDEQRNKLSTFSGVFLPCIMSIYNVLMYIRFPWMVGTVGFVATLVLFLMGFFVAVATTLSMSAIAANGEVGSGGVYFILSRTLGPTLGGAVGFLTYIADAISGNLSILGMLAALRSRHNIDITGLYEWDTFLQGSIALAIFTGITLVDTKFFERITPPLFSLSCLAILFGLAGFVFGNPAVDGWTGFSYATFKENLWLPSEGHAIDEETGQRATPMFVFAVFYPCATGILAGVNMSGDLKTPDVSIPNGTLWSLVISFLTYVLIVFFAACSIKRETLVENYDVMSHLCVRDWIIVYSVVLTGFLAALTGMMGAGRILQRIARDDLFGSWFSYLGTGSGPDDIPRRAIMATWALNQIVLLITEINVLSPIITEIFLVAYGMICFACFISRVVGVVNFRPTFRAHHWSISLLGFLACVIFMFAIDLHMAMLCLLLFAITAASIALRGTSHINWGDLSQAAMYHQVRKYLLQMSSISVSQHVKYWRPEIMVLTQSHSDSLSIIALGNALKKGGMYSVTSVLVGDFEQLAQEAEVHVKAWTRLLSVSKIKAFANVTISDSVGAGTKAMALSGGLGAMKPNTILLGFPSGAEDLETDLPALASYSRVYERSYSVPARFAYDPKLGDRPLSLFLPDLTGSSNGRHASQPGPANSGTAAAGKTTTTSGPGPAGMAGVGYPTASLLKPPPGPAGPEQRGTSQWPGFDSSYSEPLIANDHVTGGNIGDPKVHLKHNEGQDVKKKGSNTIHGHISLQEYGSLCRGIILAGRNLLIVRNLADFDPDHCTGMTSLNPFTREEKSVRIEVWLDVHLSIRNTNAPSGRRELPRNSALFALQMAHVLSRYRKYHDQLSIHSFKYGDEACQEHESFLQDLKYSCRINAEVAVFNTQRLSLPKDLMSQDFLTRCSSIAQVIRSASKHGPATRNMTTVRFVTIADVPSRTGKVSEAEAEEFFRGLARLSRIDDTTTIFCYATEPTIALKLG